MARKKQLEEATVNEIPPEVLGAVVLADLAQIRADAATHPDQSARARILKAVNRLQQIAEGQAPTVEGDELAMA